MAFEMRYIVVVALVCGDRRECVFVYRSKNCTPIGIIIWNKIEKSESRAVSRGENSF